MNHPFSPPWDQPCWGIIDLPALLSNIDSLGPTNAILDVRWNLLAKVAPLLGPQLKRRGLNGFLTQRPSDSLQETPFMEGWQPLLAPGNSCASMIQYARKGFLPVIGQSSEALYLSNQAQSYGISLKLFLRVRGEDLMADQGTSSLITLLELLPSLPNTELAGFYMDSPFRSWQACEAFTRVLTRNYSGTRSFYLIGRDGGTTPPRCTLSRLISQEVLGMPVSASITATTTIQGWGIPVSVKEQKILVALDLGTHHGLHSNTPYRALMNGFPGKAVSIEEFRTIFEFADRPPQATPWVVTLLGSDHSGDSISPTEWPFPSLMALLNIFAERFPLLVKTGNEIQPLSVAISAVSS